MDLPTDTDPSAFLDRIVENMNPEELAELLDILEIDLVRTTGRTLEGTATIPIPNSSMSGIGEDEGEV